MIETTCYVYICSWISVVVVLVYSKVLSWGVLRQRLLFQIPFSHEMRDLNRKSRCDVIGRCKRDNFANRSKSKVENLTGEPRYRKVNVWWLEALKKKISIVPACGNLALHESHTIPVKFLLIQRAYIYISYKSDIWFNIVYSVYGRV